MVSFLCILGNGRIEVRKENADYYIKSAVCAGKMDGEGFFGRMEAGKGTWGSVGIW